MHPNQRSVFSLLALVAIATALPVFAQETPAKPASQDPLVLEKVIVQSAATPTANTLAGAEQIHLQPASSSVINVIKYLPGVNLSQGDAIGSDDWSTHVTIRGFNDNQLGFTLDGVASGFTGYAGGTKPNRYVDIENLSRVVVSQGAADISSASSQALGGTLAYFTADPAAQIAAAASYTAGTFNTTRAFVRADTGKFGGDNRAFLSFSSEQNDNWVGHFVGGAAAETKRLHFDAKDITQLGAAKLTFYLGWDNVNPEINYQGVSKQQFAQDPRNDQLTFNWTGNPVVDQNYAQTWTTIRTNGLAYFKIEVPLSDALSFAVQPYWHHQYGRGEFLPPYQIRRYNADGTPTNHGNYQVAGKPTFIFYQDGSGNDLTPYNPADGTAAANPYVIGTYTWLTPAQQAAAKQLSTARFSRYQNNRYGDNLAFNWNFSANNKLDFGMWSELQERLRHRTWHNVLNPLVGPAFDATPYLDQFLWHYRTTTNMPYVQDQFTVDKFVFTAGVKYYSVKLKVSEDYLLPTGATGFHGDLSSNSSVLPSLGVQYKLDSNSELFASFSSNFSAVPDAILESGAAGVDLTKVKPEKAENIDFGYRFAAHNLALSATGFYTKYRDKLIQLTGLVAKDYTNASSGVWTNIGGTEAYGTEVAANYRLTGGFSLLGSFSYTRATYTKSTPDGTIIGGKRVVDTPDYIASYGLLYDRAGFEAGLVGKYTGVRYGTYSNDNSAGAFTVYDLNFSYTRNFSGADFIKTLGVSLAVENLFDKNYLGSVSTNDQGYVKNDPTGTTMLWNIGAPRTVMFTVKLGF